MTAEERAELKRRVGSPTTPQRDMLRARIVLLCVGGCTQREAARRLVASLPCVNKRSQRFGREGLPGLRNNPGRVRKRSIPERTVQRLLQMAGQAPPGHLDDSLHGAVRNGPCPAAARFVDQAGQTVYIKTLRQLMHTRNACA